MTTKQSFLQVYLYKITCLILIIHSIFFSFYKTLVNRCVICRDVRDMCRPTTIYWIDWLIDWIEFYAVSLIIQPCNGGLYIGMLSAKFKWNWPISWLMTLFRHNHPLQWGMALPLKELESPYLKCFALCQIGLTLS